MLNTLEHGVTQTATTTIVVLPPTPLSPAAVDAIDPLHHLVTIMTMLDCGVHQLVRTLITNLEALSVA